MTDKKDSGENVISEIKIILRQNGKIDVDGPLNNFPLFIHMMNAAERSVLDRMIQLTKQQANPLIKPLGMI